MEVELDLNKSVEENAEVYFKKAKTAKKKIEGAKKALLVSMDQLKKVEVILEKQREKQKLEKEKQIKEKKWYDKFHYLRSKSDFFILCGKDATTNEILIKKYVEKDDLVFHTQYPGSPFCVVKGGQKCDDETKEEAAQVTASYSRGWKTGVSSMEVFYINPDQVSKKAMSGEYLNKGSFMIYGKRNFLRPKMELAIGNKKGEIIVGTLENVKSKTDKYVVVVQGKDKKSDVAKKIQKKIGGDLDEILQILPNGGSRVL